MKQKHNLVGVLCILAAAVIWGSAFSMQSMGAAYVDAFTYLAFRSWIAFVAMIPVVILFRKRNQNAPVSSADNKMIFDNNKPIFKQRIVWTSGAICGFFLYAASAAQQMGIAYTTAAKSGFITALYVVLVPILSLVLFRKKVSVKIWCCVLLSVIGLYMLSISGSVRFNIGDIMTLICAVLFSMQILSVGHFVNRTDVVLLSWMQFFFVAVYSTITMFVIEHPTLPAIGKAMPSLLYVGILSSAVGYTLQNFGQKEVTPTVASILMGLESVFSALFGWIILQQALTAKELFGCGLMFLGLLLSQIPIEKALARRAQACTD